MPIRGGNWNNGALAGVFALNVNNARSNVNSNIGSRPASEDMPEVPGCVYGLATVRLSKGLVSTAKCRNSVMAVCS